MHLPSTCGLGLTVTTGLFADAPMVGCLLGGVPVGLYIPALITFTRPVALGRSRTPADTVDPVDQSSVPQFAECGQVGAGSVCAQTLIWQQFQEPVC